jgi:hypothetical protein
VPEEEEAEFEKQIATRVETGDRVVVVDNAKTRKPIESPVCITYTRLNFRRLGSNTSITRSQNDIIFCLSMNLTALGQDLRRRAAPVNLVVEQDVRGTTYAQADIVGFVFGHRLAIVGEMADTARTWLDQDRPGCENPARHSTSQLWASTLDAILRFAGFNGLLTNFKGSAHAFDPALRDDVGGLQEVQRQLPGDRRGVGRAAPGRAVGGLLPRRARQPQERPRLRHHRRQPFPRLPGRPFRDRGQTLLPVR